MHTWCTLSETTATIKLLMTIKLWKIVRNIYLISFIFYSSISRLKLEVAHSSSWWIIWQIVQEIWKGFISPKPVYTRTRQTIQYSYAFLEANEFVMEESRELSWTVPSIFQSQKLLRRKLLFTAKCLRSKGNMDKFPCKKSSIQQMWRRDIWARGARWVHDAM